jgi:glycosyltransferase involved in cell wall biosynthesis
MKNIDISFIIPCYNAEKTINKCLDSIFNQDFNDISYEVIVVDNNSYDQSLKLLKNYKDVIVASETLQGRSYTRQRGATLARGKYLAFIDADVYLDVKWSMTLWSNFENDDKRAAGQGQIIPCLKSGHAGLNRFRYRCVDEETRGKFILTLVKRFESPMINSAACFYRRDVYNELGGFDVQLERHEDIDLSRRTFFSGHDLYCTSEARAYVIFHGEGWLDYLKRSFADGYYKIAYLKKWSRYEAPFPHFNNKKWLIITTIFKVASLHSLMKFTLSVVNMLGRLAGRVSRYHLALSWITSTPSKRGRVTIDDQTLS